MISIRLRRLYLRLSYLTGVLRCLRPGMASQATKKNMLKERSSLQMRDTRQPLECYHPRPDTLTRLAHGYSWARQMLATGKHRDRY